MASGGRVRTQAGIDVPWLRSSTAQPPGKIACAAWCAWHPAAVSGPMPPLPTISLTPVFSMNWHSNLSDFDTPRADIYVVYPERLNLSAKGACFVEHLRSYPRELADGPSPIDSNG